MDFFDTSNTMIHITLGSNGYNLTYVETVAAIFRFLYIC